MSMTSAEIKALSGKVFMNTYNRYDLALVRGEGTRVWDPEGNEYTDFLSGIAVASLGHANPVLAAALAEQARTLVHVSNLYYTEPQTRLAAKLVDVSFADRVFLCNSGAEANEAAIKLARKYSYDKYGEGRFKIITALNSFHGRTMSTLSATGQAKLQKGFEPLHPGFEYVPYNDVEALEKALTDDACAFLVEPIQGEGGIVVPDADYLSRAAEACRKKDVLVIFDEVQVGMGRTGKMFAYEHFNVTPDIMTLAKALGNGMPIGACLAREEAAAAFGHGTHGSTFGGTPLASAAALAATETISDPGFLARAAEVGAYFRSRLDDMAARLPYVKEVRGLGLLLGIDLTFKAGPLVAAMQKRGFLINSPKETVLRFAPPLIITEKEVDRMTAALEEALAEEAAKAEEAS